jgi:RimJ/RimL family protein N-acetyltransferase
MTVLTTARLRLEPLRETHLHALHAMNIEPEVKRFLGGQAETLEQTHTLITRVQARWLKYGFSWWGMIELATDELVGAGCIQHLRRDGDEPDPNCPLEIGWRLRPDRWHRGLASEAAVVMTEFAFARLHAATLYAVCHPDNHASAAVMRRLGMRYRGIESWYGKDLATYEIASTQWASRGN